MTDLIQTLQSQSLFEIALNRPDKRNAITWEMFANLDSAIDQAEHTPGVHVILLYGNGGGFSTGIDLNAFSHIAESFGENWQEHMLSVTAAFQNVLNKLERCSLPSIALLRGYALGLGLELALACDFRIAARHTKIALPETRLGLIPDVGGTTRLTRLIGPSRAKEVIFTGKIIELEQAVRWGLVNAIVPGKDLFAKGEILAAEIIQAAPLAVSAAKRVIDGLADIDRGLQMEAWAQNHLIQTADFQTGLQAARSKSAPTWQGK